MAKIKYLEKNKCLEWGDLVTDKEGDFYMVIKNEGTPGGCELVQLFSGIVYPMIRTYAKVEGTLELSNG